MKTELKIISNGIFKEKLSLFDVITKMSVPEIYQKQQNILVLLIEQMPLSIHIEKQTLICKL